VAEARADSNALTGSGQALCKWFVEKDEYTPPRVFFVRVANTGLMLDAASRIATTGDRATGASVERPFAESALGNRVGRQRRTKEDK
jgi:hypothetical protein